MNHFQAAKRRRTALLIASMLLAAWSRVGLAKEASPVPPTLEIEVLDPQADPLGNPAIEFKCGQPGELTIDIPPVVLVHRYYYTGDRNFQGPMLPGGPSIVVINHPKTGERLYIPVQMLPGAPKVTYHKDSIRYDYGENAITIAFGLLGNPVVNYRNGVRLGTRAKNLVVKSAVATGALVDRTGAPEVVMDTAEQAKNLVVDAADGIHTVGTYVAIPMQQILSLVPFAKVLEREPQDRAYQQRQDKIRRAAEKASSDDLDLRTLR